MYRQRGCDCFLSLLTYLFLQTRRIPDYLLCFFLVKSLTDLFTGKMWSNPSFVKVFVPWYWDFMVVDSSWWPTICVFCSSFVTSNGNDTDFEMCLNYVFVLKMLEESTKLFN